MKTESPWADWIGRQASAVQYISPEPLAALAATLDMEPPAQGAPLPICGHWIYFASCVRASQLGLDGHPRLGDLMPPSPLPRRMFAASRIERLAPMHPGETIRKTTRIASVIEKNGKSGKLLFVELENVYSRDGDYLLRENQTIVYRGEQELEPTATSNSDLLENWDGESLIITPDPVLLFRFSALTFNSHRIHYDHDYACNVEGYRGLVVQGPLIATLLANRVQGQPKRFTFKAVAPAFCNDPLTLQSVGSESVQLRAIRSDGRMVMQAEAGH